MTAFDVPDIDDRRRRCGDERHAVATAILARIGASAEQAGPRATVHVSRNSRFGVALRTHGQGRECARVVLKIAVAHADETALELFSREIFPSRRPCLKVSPASRPAGRRAAVVRLASCLVSIPGTVQIEVTDGLHHTFAGGYAPGLRRPRKGRL